MSGLYLLALLVSFACMLLVDRRFGLVFWHAPLRAVLTIALGAVVFVGWDSLSIAFGFYYLGDSPYMTHWEVAPELPVEELVFIAFFCHLSLVAYRGAALLLDRRERVR